MNSGGLVHHGSVNLIQMLSHNIAPLIWVAYSLLPEIANKPSANRLRTQRWEQSLTDLQRQSPNDSLIPMFETMVERAFSRSSSLESGDEHSHRPVPTQVPRVKTVAAGSRRG